MILPRYSCDHRPELNRQHFPCSLDADKALTVWLKPHKERAISDSEILKLAVFKQSGRPKLNQPPDGYEYQITGQLYWSLKSREERLMVMMCCLMVYAALEHKIRRELKAQSAYFPNLKYKPCQNPTARWVFFCFQGVDVLTVNGEQQ